MRKLIPITLAASLMFGTSTLASAADSSTDNLASLRAISAQLRVGGFQHIEDIEPVLFGNWKVEARDAKGDAAQVYLSADGSKTRFARPDFGDDDDAGFDVDTLDRLLSKLEADGYRQFREISYDHDGFEVEVIDAKGQRRELKLDAASFAVLANAQDD
ncbi:PepSY domain-containing protein [uncultured Nevskia sp.]|uniref:PepSY domain-containing protein n=1 Tax=uncultured Nevskia sp. TaxID=228950 RepID=UPI0025CC7D1D|nr:PepSY domain-containing protein [uncultured Nevskia sp.]